MSEAYRFGPLVGRDGVTFRLWAPGAKSVALLCGGRHEMQGGEGGWFTRTLPEVAFGTRYSFRVDDKIDVPDPASRFQPDDVHGPSELIDPTYDWQESHWKGRPWHECIFLELHVGSFSGDGTYRSVIERLDHIVEAGFTAIELMPVADFYGRWNWGYDGVLLYAPDSAYGRPDELRALIDAAHRRGLMVFLDVVYNHFGPEGNYLGRYAPRFFCKADTPWGNAIDYENASVRRFAVDNAIYWLRDFRFDGLRLDAVHAIIEPGRGMLLKELSEAAGRLASESARHIHLVLENDANQASLLDPSPGPSNGKYRAQWNDDFHHVFHVMLTGETAGYYSDYREPARQIARTVGEGFVYQGEPSSHRHGEQRGEPTSMLPATAFVNFLQNHDQIGNRALGERLSVLAEPAAVEAAIAITLLVPAPPLMFMGDEWGAREPFPFFCDFKGELADAVRNGRRKEFAEAYASHHGEVPDPLSEDTLQLARLDWSAIEQPEHRARLNLVRRLLTARKSFVTPRLPQLQPGGHAAFADGILTAKWTFASGETLSMLANLGEQARSRPGTRPGSFRNEQPIWGGSPPATLPPWSVYAAIETK